MRKHRHRSKLKRLLRCGLLLGLGLIQSLHVMIMLTIA